MATFNEDHFKAAINMIRVTPEDYKSLTAEMIMHLYAIVAFAEKELKDNPSVYDGLTVEQIKKRLVP